jgi:hypothetical protein
MEMSLNIERPPTPVAMADKSNVEVKKLRSPNPGLQPLAPSPWPPIVVCRFGVEELAGEVAVENEV